MKTDWFVFIFITIPTIMILTLIGWIYMTDSVPAWVQDLVIWMKTL